MHHKSLSIAQDIFNVSRNLRNADVVVPDVSRVDAVKDIVGDEGYKTFNPTLSPDIAEEFIKRLKEDTENLQTAYWGDHGYGVATFNWEMASTLISNTTTDDLIENRVPVSIIKHVEYIERNYGSSPSLLKQARTFKTPKLTRLVSKLAGETSETMKWLTNHCPKKIEKGVNKEYTVTISTMPHHMAGMSYYAAGNWGGDNWHNGWEGTSCMDTKRNGQGKTIIQLPAAMKMDNVFIAYLSMADADDIWNPIYLARSLVHAVEVHGKTLYLACKTYATSKEMSFILREGLFNEFGVLSTDTVRSSHSGDTISFTHHFEKPAIYTVAGHCSDCNGEGNSDEDHEDYCPECEGDSSSDDEEFFPYIDDNDFIEHHPSSSFMEYCIPVSALEEYGFIKTEKEEEVVEEPVEVFIDTELEPVASMTFDELETRVGAMFFDRDIALVNLELMINRQVEAEGEGTLHMTANDLRMLVAN